jgi:hypothetical protein
VLTAKRSLGVKGNRYLSLGIDDTEFYHNLNEFGSGFFPGPPSRHLASSFPSFSCVKPGAERPLKPAWTSDILNYEKINLCDLKQLSLW